ncbi:family 20 glycosylhydrolase, partial [Escherichia coli]
RGIRVVPEIDFPGHASAIAVAYPELISAAGPYQMQRHWGVHPPLLNPTQESVYQFTDALIGELATIFPDEYIHIGGDEVHPTQWQNNPSIQ